MRVRIGMSLVVLWVTLLSASPVDAQPAALTLRVQGAVYPTAEATFTPPIADQPGGVLTGQVVWTGSDGCQAAQVPAATRPRQIALFQRGDCLFLTKGQHALAKGYTAFVVANNLSGGDAVTPMAAPPGATVAIPGLFVGYTTGEILKAIAPHGELVVKAARP